MEKEAHDKDLQSGHRHHHQSFNDTEIEDSALSTANGAEVAILARTEVLLVARNGRQLGRQLVDGLLETASLLGTGTLSRRKLVTLLILNLTLQG